MSMGAQNGGASSSTRLQPQLTSSSLGLTPVLGTAGDVTCMFTSVMPGLEELRHQGQKGSIEWRRGLKRAMRD